MANLVKESSLELKVIGKKLKCFPQTAQIIKQTSEIFIKICSLIFIKVYEGMSISPHFSPVAVGLCIFDFTIMNSFTHACFKHD